MQPTEDNPATFPYVELLCRGYNTNDNGYDLRYILGVINSRLLNFFFQSLNPEQGEALAEVKKENVGKLLIAQASQSQQKPIVFLVDRILATKKNEPSSDTSEMELEIDRQVYNLYGLTKEEIAIVEGRAGGHPAGAAPAA